MYCTVCSVPQGSCHDRDWLWFYFLYSIYLFIYYQSLVPCTCMLLLYNYVGDMAAYEVIYMVETEKLQSVFKCI